MAGGNVLSGQTSFDSTITTASTAEATTFADRFGYFSVTNLSATAGQILYVTADGSTPVASGAGNQIAVLPGETRVITNGLPLWYQSSKLIPSGAILVGDGAAYSASTNPSTPANPGRVQDQRALAGGMQNPGGKVTVMSATAALPYAIEGSG